MKILVLNGSPKGQYSITLQSVRYLEKRFPEHSFTVYNVGQKIKSLEKDFAPADQAIKEADVLLFSYPVYTFIAPCQLHRFIELLKASGISLKGKFVSQITTSKHFYDVTAHRYVQDNCQDLGIKYVRGLSADMDDLLTDKGQKELEDYFRYFCWCVEHEKFEHIPEVPAPPKKLPVFVPECTDEKQGDVVIVTDCEEENYVGYL